MRRSRCAWCDHGFGAVLDSPFTGLSSRQFGKLVTILRRKGADAIRRGRPWGLPLEDRALLAAAYWRMNLGPLFGVSKSTADRIIDRLGPMLALRLRKRFANATVLIVDGTPWCPPSLLVDAVGRCAERVARRFGNAGSKTVSFTGVAKLDGGQGTRSVVCGGSCRPAGVKEKDSRKGASSQRTARRRGSVCSGGHDDAAPAALPFHRWKTTGGAPESALT